MDCVGRVLGGILSRFRITLPDEIQEHKRYARSMYHNALECDGIREAGLVHPIKNIYKDEATVSRPTGFVWQVDDHHVARIIMDR